MTQALERSPVTLLCPVRGCRQGLVPAGTSLRCSLGHAFDRARSGYFNLLQPQDRRSLNAGDAKPIAQARRRLFEAGLGELLLAAIRAGWGRWVANGPEEAPQPERAILDVGCGEGSMLGTLAAETGGEAHGLDLSTPAIDLAARRFPGCTWVVANADRFLPYADGSFDLVMTLTARLHAPELARVLAPRGLLLVALAGVDDLIELRQAVQGEGRLLSRVERTAESFSPSFELLQHEAIGERLLLDPPALHDLLATTYRGARHSEQERVASLAAMAVTLSRDLLWMRKPQD